MAYRDDEVALRSRIEMLEAENRRLLELTRTGPAGKSSAASIAPWVLGLLAVALAGAGWYFAYRLGGREQEVVGAVLASAGALAAIWRPSRFA